MALVVACAPPQEDNVRPHAAAQKKDDDTTTSEEPLEEAAEKPAATQPPVNNPVGPGGESATTYIGTLDATPTVRFGGSGTSGNFCNYDVTLKTVAIEVSALPSGEIIAASVKDTMVEASVPPCTYAPAPPSDQAYAFTTATANTAGMRLAFKGAAANKPATSLVVDLVKKGGSYEAAATWHRTDQKDPLDWTVRTKITLGPR